MAEQSHHVVPDIDEARMGKMLVRSIAVSTPAAIVLITGGVWLGTDQTLLTSFTSAVLPGVLTGVFGGGFIGMMLTGE